jgi:TolB-like protein/DNA-binding winged helix-turn-helix (wHTH) protein/Tfp pilus assembly protein PilF
MLLARSSGFTMRSANARRVRRHYSCAVHKVLPAHGIFSELFQNAVKSNRSNSVYEFGPFVLNPAEHTLLRDGESVPLRPKVFDTLLVLVKNSGHLVEKDELMSAVWQGHFVEEGNLNKTISMLRQALGESAEGNRFIETVPKRGYRFVADVRDVDGTTEGELVVETRTRARIVVEEEDYETLAGDRPMVAAIAHERATQTAAVLAQPAVKLERRSKSTTMPAAAAAVIVLAVVAYLFYPARNRGAAIESVTVLPFVNDGSDPELEYLSDGISESLINSLSQLSSLKVIARSSSFKYKGKAVDPQEAARSLGVEAIVTGRVLRRGDQVQISLELIDARDNTRLWGERYNRDAADLLSLESEISRDIVANLRRQLTAGEQRQLTKRDTISPVAYELLLKGRFYANKGGTDNQKRSIEYFKQAIEVDSAYALAYASLSLAYSALININGLDPREFIPKAEMAARKAVDLDENLAEAHLAMADVNSYAWEWAAAEREHKRALELNPNLAPAHRHYMFYLIIHGRDDEAFAEGRRARELDPLSLVATAPVYELLLAGQMDQAIEAAKNLLAADGSNPDLHTLVGYVYARKGQYAEAIAAYEKGIRLGDDSTDAQIYLGEAYAKARETEKARAILKQLEEGNGYVSPSALAIICAALGEKEKAFALLDRAYSVHDQQLIWLGIDGGYVNLRSDPRFQDLMHRLGLPYILHHDDAGK